MKTHNIFYFIGEGARNLFKHGFISNRELIRAFQLQLILGLSGILYPFIDSELQLALVIIPRGASYGDSGNKSFINGKYSCKSLILIQ